MNPSATSKKALQSMSDRAAPHSVDTSLRVLHQLPLSFTHESNAPAQVPPPRSMWTALGTNILISPSRAVPRNVSTRDHTFPGSHILTPTGAAGIYNRRNVLFCLVTFILPSSSTSTCVHHACVRLKSFEAHASFERLHEHVEMSFENPLSKIPEPERVMDRSLSIVSQLGKFHTKPS